MNATLMNASLSFVPMLVAKVTLLLAASASIAFTLRHASAAARHLVWFMALAGSLALVVLSPAAPRLVVSVPRPALSRVAESQSIWVDAGRYVVFESVTKSAVPEAGGGYYANVRDMQTRYDLGAVLIAVWLIGSLAILIRCVLGHIVVARIVARAERVSDRGEWRSLLRDVTSALRVRRGAGVLLTESLTSPVTSGVVRPVVLLPVDAVEWTAERRRVVLVHELAHVARFDYVAQLVATVACALFWFHPAIWFAAARLRAEAEQAADDCVLAAGTHNTTYATHLLELASHRTASLHLTASVAVGMARTSQLEGRVRAMLDTTRSRGGLSRRAQFAVAALTLAALVPLAGLRTKLAAAPLVRSELAPTRGVANTTTVTQATRAVRSAASVVAALGERATTASDSVIETSIPASPGERLTLDLRTGGTIVVNTWDQPQVRVRALLGGRDWEDTRVDIERVSGGVRVRSTDASEGQGSRSTSHKFEVTLPRTFDIDVSSAGGGITIDNLVGEIRGHTGGGALEVRHSTGTVALTTGGGDVRASDSDLTGTMSTGGGEVAVSNAGTGLRATSASISDYHFNLRESITGTRMGVSGGISGGINGGVIGTTRRSSSTEPRITVSWESAPVSEVLRAFSDFSHRTILPSKSVTGTITASVVGLPWDVALTEVMDANGYAVLVSSDGAIAIGKRTETTTTTRRMNITKAGGGISLGEMPYGGTLITGGGGITIRSSNGQLDATTGGGDIELQHAAGDASVSTGAGNVFVHIDGSGDHTVSALSGRGTVVIEVPASFDGRFELESAYTKNSRGRTTISSDWPLQREETADWDDREGTPRKYVRATAVIGSGRGVITVRTVNGDVTIKRVR